MEEEFEEEITKLCAKTFDITKPIVLLFNDVENMVELSNVATANLTVSQQITLGIHLIKNTNNFETALTNWYAKPAAEKTWLNSKTYFI